MARKRISEREGFGFSVTSLDIVSTSLVTIRIPYHSLPDIKGKIIRLEPRDSCTAAQMREALEAIRIGGALSVKALPVRSMIATPEMVDAIEGINDTGTDTPSSLEVLAVLDEMARESAIDERLNPQLVECVREFYEQTE